jgi:hypothetical protein
MASSVAIDAECDEIFFDVLSQRTSKLKVMNLKIPSGAAVLTTPSIPIEDSPMQYLVGFPIDSQPRVF